jgi:hypothetical protein
MDARKDDERPRTDDTLPPEFGTPYVDDSNPTEFVLGVRFPGDEEASPSPDSMARTDDPVQRGGVPYWNPRQAGETLAGKITNVEGEWIEWLGTEVPLATIQTDDGPVLLRVAAIQLRDAWSKSRPTPAAGDEIVLRFEGTKVNERTSHEFELYDLHVTLDEDPLKAKEFLQDALATGPRVVSHLSRGRRDEAEPEGASIRAEGPRGRDNGSDSGQQRGRMVGNAWFLARRVFEEVEVVAGWTRLHISARGDPAPSC